MANFELFAIVYLNSPNKKRTPFVSTRLGFESLCRQVLKHLIEGRFRLPNDPKIIVRICFGAFWVCNTMFSYGRLTTTCSIVVFVQNFLRSFKVPKMIFKKYFCVFPCDNSFHIPKKSSTENPLPQELIRKKEYLRSFFPK